MSELKRDETVHCLETMTGRNLTGTLELGTKSLHAEIVSYDDFFALPDEGPIHLRTAGNHYVSLYDNIVSRSGDTWTKGPPEVVTYNCDLISNCAVVGPRFWQPEDRVRRVTFRVPHAEQILRNRAYLEAMEGREERQPLLEVESGGTTVKVWYSGTYNFDFKAPREHWPIVELEFASGLPLEDVMERVFDIVELFALSLWTPLRPDDIRVCTLATAELRAAVEAQTYQGDHAVAFVWHDREVDRSRVWAGASPVVTFDDEALKTMEAVFTAWLERRAAWKAANSMMMQVLSQEHEVTADRLIAACRWLEEIPGASSAPALSDEHLAAITAAAADKASELGHGGLASRIIGTLRFIKGETHEARFTRLLASIGETFGLKRFVDEALPHLVKAQRLRGTAAHGYFAHEGEQVFKELYAAILATEALCALLTLQDLPLDEKAVERTRSHRALEAFLLSYK